MTFLFLFRKSNIGISGEPKSTAFGHCHWLISDIFSEYGGSGGQQQYGGQQGSAGYGQGMMGSVGQGYQQVGYSTVPINFLITECSFSYSFIVLYLLSEFRRFSKHLICFDFSIALQAYGGDAGKSGGNAKAGGYNAGSYQQGGYGGGYGNNQGMVPYLSYCWDTAIDF